MVWLWNEHTGPGLTEWHNEDILTPQFAQGHRVPICALSRAGSVPHSQKEFNHEDS
jgi:hypothetical protein